MQQILEQLNRVKGVGGSLLLSVEGLPMASALRAGADENALAAGLADVLGNSSKLCASLGLGECRVVQSIGGQGGLLLFTAGKAYLAIIVDPAANLALLQIEARPFAERIAQRITL